MLAALTTLTAFIRGLLESVDASTARDTLGGTPIGQQVFTAENSAVARTGLGMDTPVLVQNVDVRTLDKLGTYYVTGGINLPTGEYEGWVSVYPTPGLPGYRSLSFISTVSSARWYQSQVNGAWGPWRSTRSASSLTEGLLDPDRLDVLPETKIPYLTPDKGFRRGNIIGPIAQSGGVPTGALVEKGTNASGYYERYASGMQICIREAQIYLDTNLFQNASLPASFVSASAYAVSLSFSTSTIVGDANVWFDNVDGIAAYNNTASLVGLLFRRVPVGIAGTVFLKAIGRWF